MSIEKKIVAAFISAFAAMCVVFALTSVTGCGKDAGASTQCRVNDRVRVPVSIFNADGTPKRNCTLAMFTTTVGRTDKTKWYRNNTAITVRPTFKNFTTGDYTLSFVPTVVGKYRAFIAYSGTMMDSALFDAYNDDVDTATAALGVRFGNNSSHIDRRHVTTDGTVTAGNTALGVRFGNNSSHIDRRHVTTDGKVDAVKADTESIIASFLTAAADAASAVWNWITGDRTVKSVDQLGTQAKADVQAEAFKAVTSFRPPTKDEMAAAMANQTTVVPKGVVWRLADAHGSGGWGGAATVTPFQGAVSYSGPVTTNSTIRMIAGDTVTIRCQVKTADGAAFDLTNWTVKFGAKANPAATSYDIPLRTITADVVAPATDGLVDIKLTNADTKSLASKSYYAEVKLYNGSQVLTPWKCNLFVDPAVIR